jgi:hypothetical protein
MSIEAQPETRLKGLIQPNGTAIGVDPPKVGTVEKVTGQAVYSEDQPAASMAFAYLRTQGSPIFPVCSRPAKSGPRIPMAGAKAVCFIFAAFVLLAPLLLTAQEPTSGAGKADSTVSQAPAIDSAETGEGLEDSSANALFAFQEQSGAD